MGLRYQETLTIPFDMVDVKQEIKLPAFLSHCLAVSGRQSEQIGRSDTLLYQEYGLVWVVTDYHLMIDRLPRYNETISIQTEAVSYNKFFCYRTFQIHSQEGDFLLSIDAYFVLIDFESRKVCHVPDELIAPYQSEKVKKMPRFPKYEALNEPLCKDYTVRYFDIDANGHVNNGKYLEWMYESLDYDFLLAHRPKQIGLKFIKEVAPTSTITSRVEQVGLTSQHDISCQGTLHAQAIIEWHRR